MSEGIWIFGYGSLMWSPGFDFLIHEPATLWDHKRDYCVLTQRHRGTEQQKGLVLGLHRAQQSQCQGQAFFVPNESKTQTLEYLERRENGNEYNLYHRNIISIWLETSRRWELAYTYIANQHHHHFVGDWDAQTKAQIIEKAKGHSGSNLEYFLRTHQFIKNMSIEEPYLEQLHQLLKQS